MAGTLKVGGNTIATHTGVEGSGVVTAKNLTVDTTVKGTSKIDGTLAFFGGHTADNRSFTLDGVSKYHVFAWVRYDADPYYPMVLTFVIDSSDGTITKKTDTWGSSVDESYNTSTKVLEIISQGGSLMHVQIFYGDIPDGTITT